jgi:single-stranded-DNA-specific exonuclease
VERIRRRRCQPGILALLEVAHRPPEQVVTSDLAFAVAPRLNAAGRLTDMSLGIECLLADDLETAQPMARQLDRLNRTRREIEARMNQQAMDQLNTIQLGGPAELPLGLCLFDEQWHQGVVGILAARIRERIHRPVIAFAPHGQEFLKGSARSVPTLHIRDAISAVATHHPGLVCRFGGHAMAAGLSLRREDLAVFAQAFDLEVGQRLSEDALQDTIYSDGPLAAADLDLPMAELLRSGGPWGEGFPEPVFDGDFAVLRSRVVNQRHLQLTLRAAGEHRPLEAIAFNASWRHWDPSACCAFLAYRLEVKVYRGTRHPQLVVEHIEPKR